jgi:hypothetical protein
MHDHYKIIKNSAIVNGGLNDYSIMEPDTEYLYQEMEHYKDGKYFYVFNVGSGIDMQKRYCKQSFMLANLIEHDNGVEIIARFIGNNHDINNKKITNISELDHVYSIRLARSIIKIVIEDGISYITECAYESSTFDRSENEQHIKERLETLKRLKFFRFAQFDPADYYNSPVENIDRMLSDNLEWINCGTEYGDLYTSGQISLAGIKLLKEVTTDTIGYCKKK